MPLGEYGDFAECVAANQDKDDPEAYCGSIEAAVGKGQTLTRDEVKKICPSCAAKMEARGWTHLNVTAATLQKIAGALALENIVRPLPPEKPDNRFTIRKIEPDKQLVFGWANVAVRKDGTVILDNQNDQIDPEVLEDAAYGFVALSGEADDMHGEPAIGRIVESMAFTPAKKRAMGIAADAVPDGWWVGFHIEDEAVFAKIKSGERRMFSIAGVAERELV